MVTTQRKNIVWLCVAMFTAATPTLAQDIETAGYGVLETLDGIDIGYYPLDAPAGVTLPGTNHNVKTIRPLAAATVAPVNYAGRITSGRIQRTRGATQCPPVNHGIAVVANPMLTEDKPPSMQPSQYDNTILNQPRPNRPARTMTWTW